MMSAWPSTDALRHPWLAGSPLKRKHSGSSSDGEVDFNNQHVHALQVSGADSQQSDGELDNVIYPTRLQTC